MGRLTLLWWGPRLYDKLTRKYLIWIKLPRAGGIKFPVAPPVCAWFFHFDLLNFLCYRLKTFPKGGPVGSRPSPVHGKSWIRHWSQTGRFKYGNDKSIVEAGSLGHSWLNKLDLMCANTFTGSLYDWSGNYNLSFYAAGSTIALSGLICFPLRRIARWQHKRELEKQKHAWAVKDSESETTSSTDEIHINMPNTTSL